MQASNCTLKSQAKSVPPGLSGKTSFDYVQPPFEVADILRSARDAYQQRYKLSYAQARVVRALTQCRTATLGGHVERCTHCGVQRIAYNSCRNRHCPKCQGARRREWLATQQAALLPLAYFHVVFTVPEELNALVRWNERFCYQLLFAAASATLLAFGERHLGGEVGITAVLHTWGQSLQYHPHVHCIVTGGALSGDGRHWQACPQGFLFPVRALSKVFRAHYCAGLQAALATGKLALPPTTARRTVQALIATQAQRPWVVYAKRPVAGAEQVLAYLSRYTHSVAISNWRLLQLANGQVSFAWKDYREEARQKVMTMSGVEFMRRFLQHVLPAGLVRIRHYGVLANGRRARRVAQWRALLTATGSKEKQCESVPWQLPVASEMDRPRCPACRMGQIEVIRLILPSRDAPAWRSRRRISDH